MRKSILFFCVILFTLFSYAEDTRQVGNLVLDGVPEIPKTLFDRLNQYQNTRSASLQDWDPSGSGMLILTRFGNTNQVHSVSEPRGYRKQITFLEEPVSGALYSRDKNRKGFLYSSDLGGGEFFQFYWFDTDSGRASLLTDGGKSVNRNPIWSKNGKLLAFSSTKRNGKDFDLYVLSDADPKTARMIKQVEGSWAVLDWSPDDTVLLVQNYISVNESRLHTLNLASGEMKEINPQNEKISYETASFGKNGDSIYYASDENSEFRQLTEYDLKSGQKRILTRQIPWNVDLIDVSRDQNWIAYVTNEGGISALYLAATSNPEKASKIETPSGVIATVKFDDPGQRLAFQISNAQSPSDVYSVDLQTKKLVRWTYSETGGLNAESFVTPELIQYPTFDSVNGKPRMIPAFYYKPKTAAENKRFPVVIRIHGGPESQTTSSFSALYQYWINELGVAVIDPNVRGSDGYGKSYLLLDNGVLREDSVKDIGKLLDWIATRPELDPDRVAVYGGSYGGYMVLSSAFHYSDRLKCAIDIYGISSFVTFLKTTESYRRDLRRAEYGDERDPKMQEFLVSISPVQNVEKIKIPLFVIQGKNDPRVPVTEAEQMVKAVRNNGGDVWYLLANDEGHGFRKKENRDHVEAAVSLFFQKYLIQ
jgi:dipeptidyl aminopeptidase/acylaminoacyl peptidase